MAGTQLTGAVQVISQALFDISESSAQQNLGELVRSADGRSFRYAYAGAVALVAGTLLQAPAQTTGNQNVAIAAAALGATAITTTGTVTLTANQLSQGYAIVSVTPGIGYTYLISSHPAVTAAVVTVTIKDTIQVALTTSSKVTFIENPYSLVIVNPTTFTNVPVGVALAVTPINYYGWIQVSGSGNVLADDTLTVGNAVQPSDTVAGAVTPASVSASVAPIVGTAMQTGTDTDGTLIFLTIN